MTTFNTAASTARSGAARTTTRWAAAPALLMALLNTASGPTGGPDGSPTALNWLATVIGIAGFVAAIALLRRVSWGRNAVLAVGVVNIAGGIYATAKGYEGSGVGIVLGALAVGLCFVPARRQRSAD